MVFKLRFFRMVMYVFAFFKVNECFSVVSLKIIDGEKQATALTVAKQCSWGYFCMDALLTVSSKKHCVTNADRVVLWVNEQEQRVCCSLFDGHGDQGDCIAEAAHNQVPLFFKKQSLNDNAGIIKAVHGFYAWLKKYQKAAALWSGTTMSTVMLENNQATLIHLGDSRIVVESDGDELFSTLDHVTSLAKGSFHLERSLGDFGYFKDDTSMRFVTPSVHRVKVHMGDHVIIASKGLWDVFSNIEVVQMVAFERNNKKSLDAIAKLLVQKARSYGSQLAISVFIFEIK